MLVDTKKISVANINNLLLTLLVSLIYVFPDIKVLFTGIQFIFIFSMILTMNNKKFNSFYIIWAALFIAYCALSMIWAFDPTSSIGTIISTIQVFILGISLSLYINENNIIHMYKSFSFAGILLIIRILINEPLSNWGTERLGMKIGYNSNTLGLSLVIAALFAYYVGMKGRKWHYYINSFVLIIVSLFTGSRKSIIIAIIGIIFLEILNGRKKIKIKNIIISIIITGVFLYLIFYNETLYEIVGSRIMASLGVFSDNSYVDSSTLTRVSLIEQSFEVIKEHPFLGVGENNFKFHNTFNVYAHVNFLEIFANLGIWGFVIYYSFPVFIFFKAIKNIMKSNTHAYLSLILISIYLILDFAMVSYNVELNHILISISYSLLYLESSITNNEKKEVAESYA